MLFWIISKDRLFIRLSVEVNNSCKTNSDDLYCSSNIVRGIKSRRIRWAGHVASMGEGSVCTGFLVGKPEGRRTLGRSRRRWEDNIKMDLQEVECGGVYWIELAQDRDRWRTFVNAAMNFQVPKNEWNFLTS